MPVEVFKEFWFEAAHFLPHVPTGHKCGHLHGHAYRVVLHLTGPLCQPEGWVMDFATVKQTFQPVLEQLDHRVLNEVAGLENPTVENLAIWIWKAVIGQLPLLSKVVVYETETSGASYSGNALADQAAGR